MSIILFTQCASVGIGRRRYWFAITQPTKFGARRVYLDCIDGGRIARYDQPVAGRSRHVVWLASQQTTHRGHCTCRHLSALVFVAFADRRGRARTRSARHVGPGTIAAPSPHARSAATRFRALRPLGPFAPPSVPGRAIHVRRRPPPLVAVRRPRGRFAPVGHGKVTDQ